MVGQEVKICGWVQTKRDHGMILFWDVRDSTGVVQVVIGDKFLADNKISGTKVESVVEIIGNVKKRPENLVNAELKTGAIEVLATSINILSYADDLPFAIDEPKEDIGEEVRLKYRYLDLRHKKMRENLILRSRVIKFIRRYLNKRGFIEVETPVISKSTPEGARDYLVPSRIEKGKFYALPQSPQQYKQLLMVAGIEKYYQIVKCFRDEDTRVDRQPEFTQLDLEMSFVEDQEIILKLIEDIYYNLVKKITPHKIITQYPFPRLTYREVMEKYNSDKPDLRHNKNDPDELAFAFIVDFPMFEWSKTENRWDAVHHPFTKPKATSPDELHNDPSKILAHQYDFVLNGYEIGGGSLRTHDPKMLQSTFEVMGHTSEQVKSRFGHLLEAFRFGVPPHGGIAPGIDRFVMILANEPNIREVIAFPKTGDGRDLMMNAPDAVDKSQLDELGLKIVDNNKNK